MTNESSYILKIISIINSINNAAALYEIKKMIEDYIEEHPGVCV